MDRAQSWALHESEYIARVHAGGIELRFSSQHLKPCDGLPYRSLTLSDSLANLMEIPLL